VHILYSGMRSPQEPVINCTGTVFSAYGFTLEDIIVRAWEGSRWHVDITPGLRDDARFDFLMVLPQQETLARCLGLLQSAIEQQFAVHVKRERRMREVYGLTNTNPRGQMLWRYPIRSPAPASRTSRFRPSWAVRRTRLIVRQRKRNTGMREQSF
jgi:uncharacterized protein (TIGR03435 family)